MATGIGVGASVAVGLGIVVAATTLTVVTVGFTDPLGVLATYGVPCKIPINSLIAGTALLAGLHADNKTVTPAV